MTFVRPFMWRSLGKDQTGFSRKPQPLESGWAEKKKPVVEMRRIKLEDVPAYELPSVDQSNVPDIFPQE